MERKNNGKIGRPYEYPIEFFIYLAKIRSLWNVPFRVLEAFVREFSNITGKFYPISSHMIHYKLDLVEFEELRILAKLN